VDLVEALSKDVGDVVMATGKPGQHSVQQRSNPVFRKRKHPRDNPLHSPVIAGSEGPEQNTGLVRP
jgi:hypothetical protein